MSEPTPRHRPHQAHNTHGMKSPHWFSREANGSVRFRLTLPPDLASLIEEAAGDTPLMVYIQRVLRERASYHVRKREEINKTQWVPRDVPDDEDIAVGE